MNENEQTTTGAHDQRQVAMAARHKGVRWGVAMFAVSALLVLTIAGLASGVGAALSAPALLVALALGLAIGWTAGLVISRLETVRLMAEGIEARVSQARREAARQR
jgi:hypothetical protein